MAFSGGINSILKGCLRSQRASAVSSSADQRRILSHNVSLLSLMFFRPHVSPWCLAMRSWRKSIERGTCLLSSPFPFAVLLEAPTGRYPEQVQAKAM